MRGFLRKPLSPEMIERSLDAAIATALPLPAEMLPQVAVAAALESATVGEEAAGTEYRPVTEEYRHVLRRAVRGACLYRPVSRSLGWDAGLDGWEGLARPEGCPRRAREQPAVLFLKNVGMFFVSPFLALAYFILFPFIGLAMLAWAGGRAWRNRKSSG